MSDVAWGFLQGQLWNAFGPLVTWWLVFLAVGMIAAVCLVFAAVYFSDWIGG